MKRSGTKDSFFAVPLPGTWSSPPTATCTRSTSLTTRMLWPVAWLVAFLTASLATRRCATPSAAWTFARAAPSAGGPRPTLPAGRTRRLLPPTWRGPSPWATVLLLPCRRRRARRRELRAPSRPPLDRTRTFTFRGRWLGSAASWAPGVSSASRRATTGAARASRSGSPTSPSAARGRRCRAGMGSGSASAGTFRRRPRTAPPTPRARRTSAPSRSPTTLVAIARAQLRFCSKLAARGASG